MPIDKRNWYYYLHTDGNLIGKNPIVVDTDPDYFNSSFVKKVWHIDLADRGDAWQLVLEALCHGANIERIKGLSTQWGLTFDDCMEEIKQRKEATPQMKKGLEIFIKSILNMKEKDFWDKIEKEWEK